MTTSSRPSPKPSFLASLKNPTQIITAWQFFQKLPFGKYLFSKVIGWIIPYTGKLSALVQKIEPGLAEVQLQERRKVQNHLKSVHALALANVGEFCSGLALFSRAPQNAQAILVELSCSYLKKARGLLTATSHCEITEFQTDTNYPLKTEIKNQDQEIVALVNTVWRIRLI